MFFFVKGWLTNREVREMEKIEMDVGFFGGEGDKRNSSNKKRFFIVHGK